ncbi:MAG: hypothetical protein AMJ78_01160 [Omnitrophica WOR_2 bacterium SM23_29]|nr:MAG: hypothetical protein AMJ78_01160 [Omnitrophica WOR_2 bacterium SM23_29]
MISIALFNEAGNFRKLFDNDPEARWCFIGKDVVKRGRITKILGLQKRFYLKGMLYEVAEELRQPYLDFVAGLGKQQKEQLNWWASKFASKCNFQTDFFLLLCYKVMTLKLIQEAENEVNIVIFIEDPWLFADLKDKNKEVRFLGYSNLFFKKLFYFIRGIIYRFLLVGWFVAAKSLMRFYHNGKKPKILEGRSPAVCILNPAEKRAFKDGEYVDNYMPGLAELYEKNDIPYFRLYLLPFAFSTAKYVGQNRELLWPLINDAKFSNLMKRIFEYWNPVLNDNGENNVNGYEVTLLLKREKCFEFSRVGFNLQLVLFDALDNFFRKKWCCSVIYLFENQPWEKMLCMSAIKNNAKAIGYQHSSIWRLFLSQFMGEDESSIMPLPHKIITSSSYFADLYRESGVPKDKIVIGGTWRYSHLLTGTKGDFLKQGNSLKTIILVSLPIDISISESMLDSIFKVASKITEPEKIDFWIKPHPGVPLSKLVILNRLPPGCLMVNKPFNELLNNIDIVITSASASGLEAHLHGKEVISYIPENLIAADALFDIKNANIYKWFEGEDLNTDFLLTPSSTNAEDSKEKFFDEINYEVWLKFVDV